MNIFENKLKGAWFGDYENFQSIALLVHGLNLNPTKMDVLAQELVDRRALVYRIELVNWQEDMGVAISELSKLSISKSVDFNIVAYSLGALLSLDVISKGRVSNLKNLILFAPPLQLRWYAKTLNLLKLFKRNIQVPSLSFKDYRHDNFIYAHDYLKLFRILDTLKGKRFGFEHLDDVSVSVILNKKDEMISSEVVYDIFDSVNNCRRLYVTRGRGNIYNHLIIDKFSLSEESWSMVLKELDHHLMVSNQP